MQTLVTIGNKTDVYVVEFIGAFFLVLTIGLSTVGGMPLDGGTASAGAGGFAPLAIGSILMVLVFMGGHISGGHYNPAVTLGVLLCGRSKMSLKTAGLYWLVQVVGGFLGAWSAYGLTDTVIDGFQPGCKAVNEFNQCLSHFSHTQVLGAELLYAFTLVSVVLNVATTESQSGNSFFGLGIGFTVMAGAYSVGRISGGAFNPAVGTGSILVHDLYKNGEKALIKYLWYYWVAPMLGGALAAAVFRLTNPKEYEEDNSSGTDDSYYQMGSPKNRRRGSSDY